MSRTDACAPKVDWAAVDTVLLDMDGTLLDLHFDNHFWLKHVPRRFAQAQGVSLAEAEAELDARYREIEGTLDWYCVDHWSRTLELDIVALKREMAHKISVHAGVEAFLQALRDVDKRSVLVTNAHGKSLALKMEVTELSGYFDRIVCAHDLGVPKEDPVFWDRLEAVEPYDRSRSLLIDDSLPVLKSARQAGIAVTLGVQRPDSKKPPIELEGFELVTRFETIMPG